MSIVQRLVGIVVLATSTVVFAQTAAANRGRYGGGQGGDYGLSQGRGGYKALGPAEILTDTMGVDFGPYLTRIVPIVRKNWYNLMPPSVYPPRLQQGKLSIEFVILKDGKTTGMVVHTSSGDVALDRAAWASITASTPFPPLPKEFPGQNLGLRFYYVYNPDPTGTKPLSEELRVKCIPFADGSVDKVLTKTMPLPPKECRGALSWMRDTRLDALYNAQPAK